MCEHNLNRMGDRIFIILVVYISVLFAWCVGRVISGNETTFVLGLNYLGVWLFSPLLFFIPWALLKRNKLGGILLSIPVGLFIWFYGLMFVPQWENQDNFICRIAKSVEEAVQLIEAGFEYVTNYDEKKMFKKRK